MDRRDRVSAMDLYLRDVPEELHLKLKAKAGMNGKTLRDFSVGILDAAVDEGVQVNCPLCGMDGPLVRFGQNARCFHCGTGFVPPEGM